MYFLRFASLLLLAVLLHVLLSWEWTFAAGVVAGFVFERRGWIQGALVVFADWLMLLIFNYVVNARATTSMTSAVGEILGNMPSLAVVAITLFIGFLLGMLGGATGAQLRRLVSIRREKVRA